MTSRFRLVLIVGSLSLAGCGDGFNAGRIVYKESERSATELEKKPQLRAVVAKVLSDKFGETPQQIQVPEGAGLPDGGRRLADYEKAGDDRRPIAFASATTGENVRIAGGYGLYRKYCLHCHGVQGGGDGPTALFLYPYPRDYRLGVFKFTSVAPSNPKPTRDDLRKTVVRGLHGTSMPAFEALMTPVEIEQVIDYVIFLSMRGETEKNLLDEAKTSDKDDVAVLSADTVNELMVNVLNNWKSVDSLVVRPKTKRVPPTEESVLRGRDIFLGINAVGEKANCTDCHGFRAKGDGGSFIDKKIFDKVRFGRKTIDEAIEIRFKEIQDEERSAHIVPGEGHSHATFTPTLSDGDFKDFKRRLETLWKPGSVDDWGHPLRPANLNLGVYKGGRRPIDLYWRIVKGINGAKMPSFSKLTEEQVWDVVNFVLALPYQPDLLKDAETLRKNAPVQPTATVTQH